MELKNQNDVNNFLTELGKNFVNGAAEWSQKNIINIINIIIAHIAFLL